MNVYVLSYMKQCRSHGLYMCSWEAILGLTYLGQDIEARVVVDGRASHMRHSLHTHTWYTQQRTQPQENMPSQHSSSHLGKYHTRQSHYKPNEQVKRTLIIIEKGKSLVYLIHLNRQQVARLVYEE